jgi:ankyrin repeat protein
VMMMMSISCAVAKDDKNDDDDDDDWYIVFYYMCAGSTEVCFFLLSEGADRDKKDKNKRKPIHIAEHLKHGEVMSLLEKHKRILF